MRWGAKQEPYNKVQIVQRLKLTGKDAGVATAQPSGAGYSLIFSAGEAPPADAPDDKELTRLLDKIRLLRRIVLQPPELIRRRTSVLRKELLAGFRSLSPALLAALTNKAYQGLNHKEWLRKFYITSSLVLPFPFSTLELTLT